MKKATFLVAFLALLQTVSSFQSVQARQDQDDRRPARGKSIESSADDFEKNLEQILEKLDLSSDEMGESLERWAEENSQELQAWSEKYGPQWESWGDRFEKKMARLAEDQDDKWNRWAREYERHLNQWMGEIDSDQIDSGQIGELIERNLDMLSKMPLGQLVDQALHDGVGELSNAPWESLGELGKLAENALEKPLHELKHAREQAATESDAIRSKHNQILEKIQREKRRHAEQLQLFNEDLRRSKEESLKAHKDFQRQNSRKTKRVDGKDLDANTRKNDGSSNQASRKTQRDKQPGRAPTTRRRVQKQKASGTGDANEDEMLKQVQKELELLRAELKRLKKEESDK